MTHSGKENVIIFDTTLRDGEQSPGATMSSDEKIIIAQNLEKMGVHVIEAGFAMASKGDFDTISQIAKNSKNSTICSLARAKETDIDRAFEAIKHAPSHRIHLFIATSPIHMKYKLKMKPEDVLENIRKTVSYAAQKCHDVEWSAEDATRSDHDFLFRCVEAAIAAGATTINLPDTVGYATPSEYGALFKKVMDHVPNAHKAVFSCHCHNDIGLATANSLAALQGGARQVECTINGLGERAGNAALEEIVMAIRTRADQYDFNTNIDTTCISKLSSLVSTISGFAIQPNKAIVGANAFAHESGIHQDGMLKHRETYEIMSPQDIGLKESTTPLGKHSGRAAVKDKLNKLNIQLQDNQFESFFERFKNLADQKKTIHNEDLYSLLHEDKDFEELEISFMDYRFENKGKGSKTGHVILQKQGQKLEESFQSTGTMDALFKAINKASDVDAELSQYNVHAVTKGTDALAEVTIRMKYKDRTFTAHGRDIDTVAASLKAYTNGINAIMKMEQTEQSLRG